MLHFLIGVAVCLFIGERLVHYWSAYRLHRAVRRSLAPPPGGYDYNPQPVSKHVAEWINYAAAPPRVVPPRELPTWARYSILTGWGFAVVFVVLSAFADYLPG
jgi:hypothetical protein